MSSPSEAAVAAREWVLHIPDYARAHAALGNALYLQSHVDQAAGAFPDYKRLALPLRETLRLKLDDAKGRDALVGQLNEAAWAWLHHGGNAYACGGIALKFARATPSSPPGILTPTLIAGPVVLDSIDLDIEDDDYKLKLKTKGLSDARVVHFRVTPGGFFGWHTHPGPVFVMITAGTLTYYDSHDPDNAVDYEAGTGFVDEGGGHVHDARNEGDLDVELLAFF